jgi:3-oxoacyl-[acyl-carrier protein] reductase
VEEALANDKTLDGQVAIITGSVRRLGKAMALALARDGAAVVIHAKSSRGEAEQAAAEVAALGGKVLVHFADITQEAEVGKMVDTVVSKFGRVDVLINNAAIRAEQHFLEMTFQQWRDVTAVVLDGAFLCSRAVLPHMVKNKYGRIINLGGVSTHLGAPGRAHVGAGKSGIVGFTRALASEFAPHGITVNCIAPGKIGGERSATSGRGIQTPTPVGREGNFEDVAAMVRLLCQPSNGYITGQTIHINGGLFMP